MNKYIYDKQGYIVGQLGREDRKMNKITKKTFKELHSNKKLLLLNSYFNRDLEELKQACIKSEHIKFKKLREVTNVNVESQGGYLKTVVYTLGRFILVHSIIDNSKDNNVSWNDVMTNTIVYVRKEKIKCNI